MGSCHLVPHLFPLRLAAVPTQLCRLGLLLRGLHALCPAGQTATARSWSGTWVGLGAGSQAPQSTLTQKQAWCASPVRVGFPRGSCPLHIGGQISCTPLPQCLTRESVSCPPSPRGRPQGPVWGRERFFLSLFHRGSESFPVWGGAMDFLSLPQWFKPFS